MFVTTLCLCMMYSKILQHMVEGTVYSNAKFFYLKIRPPMQGRGGGELVIESVDPTKNTKFDYSCLWLMFDQ